MKVVERILRANQCGVAIYGVVIATDLTRLSVCS